MTEKQKQKQKQKRLEKRKQKRFNLAAELGELTYERAILERRLNTNAKRANQLGTEMEKFDAK